MSVARFIVGDVFAEMAKLEDNSVDAIICSPPFLALRSYLAADHPDKAKEIGSETTPAAFLSTLLALTREWRRILAPHGSICVELGDTYAGSGGAGGELDAIPTNPGRSIRHQAPGYDRGISARAKQDELPKKGAGWPLDKSLCLLPTLYPASLAYGRNMLDPGDVIDPWRIRNLIVWHRPNPPVGALGDKVRPSTSYVTIACMRRDRWFDLDAERTVNNRTDEIRKITPRDVDGDWQAGHRGGTDLVGDPMANHPAGAPPLDWWQLEDDPAEHLSWTIPTQPYAGAHYATFPIALPRRLIRLMCPTHVCRQCGEPRRRMTEATGGSLHDHTQDDFLGMNRPNPRAAKDRFAQTTTVGWTDCDCKETPCTPPPSTRSESSTNPTAPDMTTDSVGSSSTPPLTPDSPPRQKPSSTPPSSGKYRRGIVLDPFAGSGTTLAAATEQGRDAIGIDLDSRNLDLARQRIGLFLEEAS